MNIFERFIGFILSLFGIKQGKSQEKIEQERAEEIRIQQEREEQLKKEVEERIKRANAERFRKALDYAVTLVYYFRGYGGPRYPDYLRTYEFGEITKEEYEKRKKEDPNSVHLVTYCNVFSRKCGRGCFDYGLYDSRRDPEYNWMNWDLTAGFPFTYTKIFYEMRPDFAKVTALKSADEGKIKKLTCEQAQARANDGIWIWGVNDGHEIVVYPDPDNEYDDTRGCKIAQAGWFNVSNVYISGSECWGSDWKSKDIHFFEFPYTGRGFLDYITLEEV